jgi:hypothetical protein
VPSPSLNPLVAAPQVADVSVKALAAAPGVAAGAGRRAPPCSRMTRSATSCAPVITRGTPLPGLHESDPPLVRASSTGLVRSPGETNNPYRPHPQAYMEGDVAYLVEAPA